MDGSILVVQGQNPTTYLSRGYFGKKKKVKKSKNTKRKKK